jgi:hypothetical protein
MKKLSLLISAFLIGSLLQAQNLPSYLPANGLVGWWPFNGNANDESGNNNNGTVNGATLTADRFGNAGKAYEFTSDFITIPHQPSLNAFPLSVFVWCKGNSGSITNAIIAKYPSLSNNGWAIHAASGKMSAYYFNFPGGCEMNFDLFQNEIPVVINNSWHLVGLICDNQSARLYVDGVLRLEKNYFGSGAPSAPSNTSNLFIGKNFETVNADGYFNGKIDDIAIYNRALTQQEITNLYSASSSGGGSNNPYASLSWPQGISYQALARNAQGTPLLNTALQIRFSLLADSINGSVEYAESQALNSNAQGLINTAFGSGTAITGTWAGINWAKGRKFLKVELNPGGGFVNLGVQELLSVPFSQRSRSAAVLENSSLPVFSGNAAALSGGLLPGQLYRTSAGVLMVVY